MSLQNKRVLVIGGAGFIGSHLVDQLRGEDVREILVYDNFTRGTRGNLESAISDPRVRIFEAGGDILHTDVLRQAMTESDCVFHLAALWLLHCHEYPRAAFDVNIRGTFNVLEACRDAKIERLVYSSSASVYGDAVETPMTEDHPFNNRTFYGATKIAGEAMCRAFLARYGVPYVGLRYMNVYGPRQDDKGAYIAVILKMLERIDRGEPPVVFGDGSQSYDFVYVEDVARANVAAMKATCSDEFFNVGTGVKTSLRELAEAVLRICGSKLPIEYAPQGQTFVTHRVGSTKRAKERLGFEATTPLDLGLRKLVEYRNEAKKRS